MDCVRAETPPHKKRSEWPAGGWVRTVVRGVLYELVPEPRLGPHRRLHVCMGAVSGGTVSLLTPPLHRFLKHLLNVECLHVYGVVIAKPVILQTPRLSIAVETPIKCLSREGGGNTQGTVSGAPPPP